MVWTRMEKWGAGRIFKEFKDKVMHSCTGMVSEKVKTKARERMGRARLLGGISGKGEKELTVILSFQTWIAGECWYLRQK